MRTVVSGAGAVGNATAFYLSKHGHDVTVVERQPAAALETSWGNGGVIHASEVEPWSQPGMPRKILKWLGKENAPLLLRYGAHPADVALGTRIRAQLHAGGFRQQLPEPISRLALLSCRSLQEIGAETGIDYDRGTRGVLKIYRDPGSRSMTPSRQRLLARARADLRAGRRRRMRRPRAGAAGAADRRWPAASISSATRSATATSSRKGVATALTERGVQLPLRHTVRRARARGRTASPRCETSTRAARGRRGRRRAGQLTRPCCLRRSASACRSIR